MKKDILETIIASKRLEVQNREKVTPISELIKIVDKISYTKRSMSEYLVKSENGIIAEFKRRSPSKGWINQDADVVSITTSYEQAGAVALSILTDEEYFGGRLNDIEQVRNLVSIPIIRKEFIVDKYQLMEAKVVGADAILLIAAALSKKDCAILASIAHELDMEVLLELHSESELEYITEHVSMVGVNNRNLGTFHTDIENSFRMVELLPSELVKISESGISRSETIRELKKVGYQGFLIGEQFMKTNSPADALAEFIKNI